jgi:iron complex transport system substrate-binding protein
MALLLAVAGAGAARAEPPKRVVSVDHCADQYVLALADRDQIAALSPAATEPHSYHAEAAEGLPTRPPTAEAILMADPDLVVRLWGGAHGTEAVLDRYDVPVAQIRYGTDIKTARANLRRAGTALGHPERARRLIAAMDRRLARAARRRLPEAEQLRAVYLTPSGATAGRGTFVDVLLDKAGVRNVAAEAGQQGWQSLDLERLALNPPDVVVAGFFDEARGRPAYWSIARHSFLKEVIRDKPFISIPGDVLTCQAWYVVDAIERIQRRLAEIPGALKPPQTAQERPLE